MKQALAAAAGFAAACVVAAAGIFLGGGDGTASAAQLQTCVFLRVHTVFDTGLSIVSRVKLPSGEIERVGVVGYRVDALGYSPADGKSYGLATRGLLGPFADGAHVIVIDPAKHYPEFDHAKDLGPVRAATAPIPADKLAGATAGTVVGDHLVVRSGKDLHEIDINPASRTYLGLVRTTPLRPAEPAMTVDDFDVRPADGMLYGVSTQAADGKVVKINPRTGAVSTVPGPPLPGGGPYGAAMIGPDGSLYAAGNRTDFRSKLYRVAIDASAAVRLVAQWPSVGIADATACLGSRPTPPPAPATTPPATVKTTPPSPTTTVQTTTVENSTTPPPRSTTAPPLPLVVPQPQVVVPTPVVRKPFKTPPPQAAQDHSTMDATAKKRRWGMAILAVVIGAGAAGAAHGRRR